MYTELGSGTYGCAIQKNKRALTCAAGPEEDDSLTMDTTSKGTPIPHALPAKFQKMETVSKLFTTRLSWEEEIQQFNRIAQIDPKHEWSLPLMATCKTKKLNDNICHKMSAGPMKKGQSYYQVHMPKAGISLDKYIKSFKGAPVPLSDLFVIMHTLLTAIVDMQSKNFGHMDLKSGNMLYSPGPKPQAFLIDYGMSGPLDIFSDPDACDLFTLNNYIFWAPELRLYGTLWTNNTRLDRVTPNTVISKVKVDDYDVERYESPGLIDTKYTDVLMNALPSALTSLWEQMVAKYRELKASPAAADLTERQIIGKVHDALLKEYTHNFDTHSAGMILFEMLRGAGFENLSMDSFYALDLPFPKAKMGKEIAANDTNTAFYARLNYVAFLMAHPNPRKRMSAKAALKTIDALHKFFNSISRPSASARPRPQSGPTTPSLRTKAPSPRRPTPRVAFPDPVPRVTMGKPPLHPPPQPPPPTRMRISPLSSSKTRSSLLLMEPSSSLDLHLSVKSSKGSRKQ